MKNNLLKLSEAVLLVSIVSCNPGENKMANKKTSETALVHDTNLRDQQFKKFTDSTLTGFIGNFVQKAAPLSININSVDWIDFTSSDVKEIPRNLAIRFLLNNDDKRVMQLEGGFYKYYFGYQINFDFNLTGLIYYRTSTDYTGYILLIINKEGNPCDEIFLAGTKGEFDPEAQKECKITPSNGLEIIEIVLDEFAKYDGQPFDALCVQTKYQITSRGHIKLLEESKSKIRVFSNNQANGRIEQIR